MIRSFVENAVAAARDAVKAAWGRLAVAGVALSVLAAVALPVALVIAAGAFASLPAFAQDAAPAVAGLDSLVGQIAVYLEGVLPGWAIAVIVGLPTLAANIVTAFFPSVIGRWYYDYPMWLINRLAFNFGRNRNADEAAPPPKPATG